MAFQLTEGIAVDAVRKNLDEYKGAHNLMLDITSDDSSLDATIKRTLPEAINAVNSAAPVSLLEATHSDCQYGTVNTSFPYWQTITAVVDATAETPVAAHVLRVVNVRASESNHIVTEITPEDSPEGRKQLDKNLCGTWDDPRLVLKNGTDNQFTYYSHKTGSGSISSFGYIVAYHYTAPVSPSTENSYSVSHALREYYIYKLTSMVLAIFGNADAAAYFDNLSKIQ